MSVLNLVPGVSLVKNTVSALAGSVVTYTVTKRNSNKKIAQIENKQKAVEKELEEIINNTASEKAKSEGRAVAKCSILKSLAWKDGVLSAEEKCLIIDYVIENSDISAAVKIKVIQDIDNKPHMFIGFYDKFSNMNIFTSKEEAKGFCLFLEDMAKADGIFSTDEEKYIKYIASKIK